MLTTTHASDSDYDPSTPPPALAKHTRRRTEKALDALQGERAKSACSRCLRAATVVSML
jgi:hypothetical protein